MTSETRGKRLRMSSGNTDDLFETQKLISSVNKNPFRSTSRKIRMLQSRADAARDARAWRAAATLYEAVLSGEPGNAAIHIQCGHMHKEAGDLPKAERHYLQAFALTPDDADLSLQLGHFYKIAGRLYEALAAYQRAARLAPDWNAPRDELEILVPRLRTGMAADGIVGGAAPTGPSLPRNTRLTAEQIAASGLFDADWYKSHYHDVANAGADPLLHFSRIGIVEGRAPGPGFDPDWYRDTYPIVNEVGIDPFSHYMLLGKDQGLWPVERNVYPRWVSAFDTITEQDRTEIRRHIDDAELVHPVAVVAVDKVSAVGVGAMLRGLQGQILRPAIVLLCLATDCPAEARQTVRAMVGRNPRFRIIEATRTVANQLGTDEDLVTGWMGPVVLLDAGAELREHAIYMLVQACSERSRLVYSDEDQINEKGVRKDPLFKPDASPEWLRQTDYLGACVLLAQDTDVCKLAGELTGGVTTVAKVAREAFFADEAAGVVHLPFVLFHDHAQPRPAWPPTPPPPLDEASLPSVSVIIPTRDHVELLRACVDSLWAETDYQRQNLEVVVVDNGSEEADTLDYLARATLDGRLRVIKAPMKFNYSRLNNDAVQTCTSDVLVLLNNDTEIQDPFWLRRLVQYAIQPSVGAVGPKLLYEDGTIQHGGVVLSIGGVAAHAHGGLQYDAPGAMGLAQLTHEVAAVTGACLAVRRSVFEEVGGLDENLHFAFNDVLFCLACLRQGYRNIYVHDVWVRHLESQTRGRDDTAAKVAIFFREARYTRRKYFEVFKHDPYYSPNLGLDFEDFYAPAFPPRCCYPWRDHARKFRDRRILILSKSFSERDPVGMAALAQVRYFAESDYDVHTGSPEKDFSGRSAALPHQMLRNARQAALHAAKIEADVVIVHSWPYFAVSRMLRASQLSVLYYGDAASAGLAIGAGERIAADLDRDLNSSSFDIVFAPSPSAIKQLDRADAMLSPPGGDLLGVWNPGLLPERDNAREARGWNGRLVALAITDASDSIQAARQLSGMRRLAGYLDDSVVIAIIARRAIPDAGDLAVFHPCPAGNDLVELYLAADLFIDLASPGEASMGRAEAGAFGLPSIRLDDELAEFRGSDAGQAAVKIAMRLSSARLRSPWLRQPSCLRWIDALDSLQDTVSSRLGGQPDIAARPLAILSDKTIIEWSGLFDGSYYVKHNKDLVSVPDLFGHFLEHGGREGRSVNPLFDSKWYELTYPEVKRSGANLLAHYLRDTGGRYDPNPYFSNRAYIASLRCKGLYADWQSNPVSPLLHYLWLGASKGCSPGPNFDPDFYCETYSALRNSGLNPLLHFLQEGAAEGYMPVRPSTSTIDPYDIDDIARQSTLALSRLQWQTLTSADIVDQRSAARFCIDLLSNSQALRARFPLALSDGSSSSFLTWLVAEGQRELGLSPAAEAYFRELFQGSFDGPILQAYLTRPTLQRDHPLALLPTGLGKFTAWLLDKGQNKLAVSIEQVRWFVIARSENPSAEIARTYCFTPVLQSLFPDGLTVFGRDGFSAWLRRVLRSDADWLDPASWQSPHSMAAQVRLAYWARPSWQKVFPAPFASRGAARALLDWLVSPQSGCPRHVCRFISSLDAERLVSELLADGINMMGHFCYPSGLRTSTIALVDGYRGQGGQVSCRDIWVETEEAEPRHGDYGGLEVYDTTIIHAQPEPFFDVAYSRSGLAPRTPRTYRVGYWYWELDTVPKQWQDQADQVDEIWTATRFVGDALRSRFKKPIYEVLPGLELPAAVPLPRSHFGLPDGQFLFLFTFHMTSIMERKNPLGLIDAFRLAFPDESSAGLVIKTSFGDKHPELMKDIREAAEGANITIIDSIYTQAEVLALMQACDAYVSLHRSEGYGLTMAEAMLLAKPVIATGYSGNLDFMTAKTGLLVDYKLVTLDRAYGPYEVGTRWAEPSVRHAAECMRKVFMQQDWARSVGQLAQADLRKRMSYDAAGKRMAARVAEIAKRRRRSPIDSALH